MEKNQEKQNGARRKVLKSVAIGGAAAATVPGKWVKPAVDTIVTPAHAQTTDAPLQIVAGTYSSTSTLAINIPPSRRKNAPQFALLDALISPAQANHLIGDICIDTDDPESANTSLFIRVNLDMSVDVAANNLDNDDGIDACINAGSPASVNPDGMTITDTIIPLDDDEFLFISGLTITSENTISGNYTAAYTSADGDDSDPSCAGSFSLVLGGTFPEAVDCRDDD
jgi:hypothetical protein